MGMWLAGFITGVVSVFVVSLIVAIVAVRYMRQIDRQYSIRVQSGEQEQREDNPMEGITYHGPKDTPGSHQEL
jgi:hypothetical protein